MQIIELHQHSEVVQNLAKMLDYGSIPYTIISNSKVLNDCYDLKGQKITLREYFKSPKPDKSLFTTILPEDFNSINQFQSSIKTGIVHNVHSFYFRNFYKAPWYSLNKIKTSVRNFKNNIQAQPQEVLDSMDHIFTPTKWMKELIVQSHSIDNSIHQIPFYYHDDAPSPRQNDDINIGIPGAINNRSRDYDLLFKAMSDITLNHRKIHLHLLGCGGSRYGRRIISSFKTLEKENFKLSYSLEFIPLQDYHLKLKTMDFLIVPCKTNYYFKDIKEIYGISNMTGAESDMAFSGTPALLSSKYPLPKSLDKNTVRFKDAQSLTLLLDEWINNKTHTNFSKTLISEKWNIGLQSEKLIQLLRQIELI